MSTSVPSFNRYRVAAIQYESTLGEKEKNVTDLLRLVEEAAQHEARLIVVPEMATTGYCWESRAEIAPHVEPIPGPTTDRFQQLAASYGCLIAMSLPEVDPATNVYYNSMALIGPEGVIGRYRKIHSYISEPRWARDGDLGMPVWETPLGRLAGLICMDAEYFETARILALHHADVLLFPTNWLDEKSPSSWWMARAFENGVYFIAANRYGLERGVQFSGGSCILNPDGSIQAYLDNGEGIVYGEVDLSRCRNKSWGHPAEEPSVRAHFQSEAIELRGPETTALVELAREFQISLVLGVAEREEGSYYNTVLLMDPEGIYGIYRKLHLTTQDRLWASPGNLGLPTFDTPTGRIGLATGYDVLFPETLRVLAGKGADLVCAPALLNFPDPIGLAPTTISYSHPVASEEYDPIHHLIWRVRAAEHNVYLALANWSGQWRNIRANGNSGIFSPAYSTYPWPEVIADEGEPALTMMTIDTREQRTGRRSSTHPLSYAPGDVAGSLTGELAYDVRDTIPGNVVRSKPRLRKRMPFWYLDLVT